MFDITGYVSPPMWCVHTVTSLIEKTDFGGVMLPALHEAARDGNLQRVQELAAAGHDVNTQFQGHTPTDIANANGNFDIMKWIQQHGGGGHGEEVDYTFSFAAEDFLHIGQIRHLLEAQGKRVHMMNENRTGPWQKSWEDAAAHAGTKGTGVIVFCTTAYRAKLAQGGGNPCSHEWEFIHAAHLNATVFEGDFGRDIPGALFLVDEIAGRCFGPI